MPKTRNGKPIEDELPSTVQRSDEHAQRTFAKAHDSALEGNSHHGDEQYAHRVAYGALKHTHEKVGDHWEDKDSKGPSDSRSESGGPSPSGQSHGGVDANATKSHLMDVARELDVKGRSSMNKDELVDAIEKANRKATASSRS